MNRSRVGVLTVVSWSLALLIGGCGGDEGGGQYDTGWNAPDATDVALQDAKDEGTTLPDTKPGETIHPNDTVAPPDTHPAETIDTTQPDTGCCGARECGVFAGCDCGACPAGQSCDAQGQCFTPSAKAPLGALCGASPECPAYVADPISGQSVFNPDFQTCVSAQCESELCLSASPGVFLNMPVCTQPCAITIDEVINATMQSGSDGIEDPDPPFSECANFGDGPGGSDYVCVNVSDPASPQESYCLPGSAFAPCDSDADCPVDEQCAFTTIGGLFSERCVARIRDTVGLKAAAMSESCNEFGGMGDLTFCQSGWCFGIGCVSYCVDDVHCDTTALFPDTGCDTGSGTCKGWASKSCTQDSDCSRWECGYHGAIFDNVDYIADLCWPRLGCEADADCADGTYCRFNYQGSTDPQTGLPAWDNMCLPKVAGGATLGATCGDPGPVCGNEDMCVAGHCSTLCDSDADCGAEQRCVVNELGVDLDGDGYDDQALPLQWCQTFVGSLTPCASQAACGAGERCELYEVASWIEDDSNPGEMMLDPDGPYLVKGLCVSADATLAAVGEACSGPSDCTSGWCLNADPAAGVTGYCSQVCQDADDCPALTFADDVAEGVCVGFQYTWGGDAQTIETNNRFGLCQFTLSSAADCAGDLSCAAPDEACSVYPIGFGPDAPPTIDYVCLSTTNADGSQPTKSIGQACDPNAEDAEGNPLNECRSGMCFEDAQDGAGYCSALCHPGGNECSGGTPDMTCLPVTTVPRKGKYQANSLTWHACRKDIECTPCMHSGFCPGDRVCVNLGQDSGTLADYRCVDACNSNADCVASGANVCTTGYDGFGNPAKGCYEMGTFPVNHCN